MTSMRHSGEPDVEKGYIGKHSTVHPTTSQHIEQVDYGEFPIPVLASAYQRLSGQRAVGVKDDKTGVGASDAASTKSIASIACSESICRASINSRDHNATSPWVPKVIRTEVKLASSRAASPIRCSIESSNPPKEHRGPLDNDDRPPKAIRIREPTRTTTWRAKTEDTILAKFRDDPGVWAISHHKSNFIKNIQKAPTWNSTLSSTLSSLWKRGQDAKSGRKPEDWPRPDEENDLRVSLAELQRMRLRKLQCKLVKHVAHMKTTDTESKDWENDLETYIKAIQDYDYMTSRCKLPRDPFYVTGERYIDSYVLHSLLGDATKDIAGKPTPVSAPWEYTEQPIGGTRNDMTAKTESFEFRKRIAIAAVAGFFLIGPMWLMVLHNTLYTCLVSTTVSVTFFGLILAYSLDSPKEVMSGTAAYAAVLVVFVGLGNA
ncbi:hypothetical protein GQX73_g3857 [Xylaria multiplex]|uniref:DUF6594 domain-containing protein n=1 Tax=Xylaria multiplex TaxID=323545 RepID=A0A7C8MSY5_9PEZI|nr:hypothetical protein GQX73_g3857 [Xylaria multiplex]